MNIPLSSYIPQLSIHSFVHSHRMFTTGRTSKKDSRYYQKKQSLLEKALYQCHQESEIDYYFFRSNITGGLLLNYNVKRIRY